MTGAAKEVPARLKDLGDIQPGWGVFGADGGRLGTVKAASGEHLIVAKGLLRRHDLFVPISFVQSTMGSRVTLSVPKDSADTLGWQYAPTMVGQAKQQSDADQAGTGATAVEPVARRAEDEVTD